MKKLLTYQLRHKVTLVDPRNTKNARGFYESNPVTVAQVFASIEPLQTSAGGFSREKMIAAQMMEEVTHKVVIRYREGVHAKLEVHYRGRVFQITSIINSEERNRELHLLCKEVISGGN